MLAAEFPDSAHLRQFGQRGASDQTIWDDAREHGFAIVSKDNDFRAGKAVPASNAVRHR
ncbi:DUF5615 family PIN-like protein [Lamprobacter modestohalophilus]|uniref:DUF5615 family PIN-like protein n=1 Tax=Lamprobacter modestohalophilus TaxID=1064514 RepID=UPI003D18F2B1